MWNFPNQGSNLCPCRWKCRVSIIGTPGKSSCCLIRNSLNASKVKLLLAGHLSFLDGELPSLNL